MFVVNNDPATVIVCAADAVPRQVAKELAGVVEEIDGDGLPWYNAIRILLPSK